MGGISSIYVASLTVFTADQTGSNPKIFSGELLAFLDLYTYRPDAIVLL